MKCKNALDYVAQALVVIGALNWGLVGLFNFNLVSTLFGTSIIARIVYILVGVAGVWALLCLIKSCKACSSGSAGGSGAA